MRVALLTEGVRPRSPRGAGGWCDRLVDGLREHDFAWYVLAGTAGTGGTARTDGGAGAAGAEDAARPAVHELALRGRRPAGRAPGALRGRQYAAAYDRLVRALLRPGERSGFGPGLYRLAELARADGGLPAFLVSDRARRVLERVWRSPGADASAGQPLVCDVLVAADLLEQCLRPLSAPWYGTAPGGLGAADLCHVVGGGPAALPALVAKQLHGVPFVVTEHGLHLREQYLGYREAPYRWPVRALLLAFFRALTEETYRQAAILTPGSAHDQQWQRRCGADPARTRVVYEGTPAVERPAAAPNRPPPPWSGPALWSRAATPSSRCTPSPGSAPNCPPRAWSCTGRRPSPATGRTARPSPNGSAWPTRSSSPGGPARPPTPGRTAPSWSSPRSPSAGPACWPTRC